MFHIQCSPFSAHTIELHVDNLKLEAATYSKSRHQSGEETPGKRQTNSHCGDRKKLAFSDADCCKIQHGDRTFNILRYL